MPTSKNNTSIEEIIIYYGAADNGKTTTLNLVIESIRSNIAGFQELTDSPDDLDSPEHKEQDQHAIFKHKETGKVIGIWTAGDDEDLKNNLHFLEKSHVQIAIMASRTKGQTYETIDQFTQKHGLLQNLLWLPAGELLTGAQQAERKKMPEVYAEKQHQYNLLMANTLLVALDSALNPEETVD